MHLINKNINYISMLSFLMACGSPSVHAQFRGESVGWGDFERNAMHIAPLAGEALNDAASYSLPPHWEAWWDEGGPGARLSAGSLNAREFLYTEEFRFEAAPESSGLAMFFRRTREQNSWRAGESNELQLALSGNERRFPSFSLLLDSDAVKKNADLGLAFGRRQSLVDYSEIFFWSIDQYYNTKETSSARWTRKPVAFGYRFQAPRYRAVNAHIPAGKNSGDESSTNWLEQLHLQIQPHATYAPVHDDASDPVRYQISRSALSARGSFTSNWRWDVESISRSEQLERPSATKIAQRTTYSAGLTWMSSATGTSASINSDVARIQYFSDRLRREAGTASASRQELIASATRSWPTTASTTWFAGVIASRGLQESKDGNASEMMTIEQAKLQSGFEFKILPSGSYGRPRGSFRTLANWDLDHLVQDFPYRRRKFRPWDGGLLQFSFYN